MLNSGLPAEGNQLLHAVRIAICEFRQVGEFGDDLAAFVPIDDPEPQNFLRFLQPLKFEKKLPVFGFPVSLEQNAVRRVGGRKFRDLQFRHGPRHLFPDSLEKWKPRNGARPRDIPPKPLAELMILRQAGAPPVRLAFQVSQM